MKRVLKIVSISLLALVVLACTFFLYVSRDTTNATTENIDQILGEAAKLNRLGGFAVSVFSPDSIYFSGGFGYQDVEKKIPYTKNTIQRIGSVSKTTIGIALLKAQEMGLLKLTDPINEHLPFKVSNPHFPDVPITIEHLTTHTSSMGYNEPVVESLYVKDANKKESLKDFMDSYFLENGSL